MFSQLTCQAIRRQAQHLVQYFKDDRSFDLKLGNALDAISRTHGYKDWLTASSLLQQGDDDPPSSPPPDLPPAHLPKLERPFLDILGRRLADVTRHSDNAARQSFAPAIAKLNVGAKQVHVSDVMKELLPLVYAAHLQRIVAMRAVVAGVAAQCSLVGDELARKASMLVLKHYPEDLHVPTMKQLPDIYRRQWRMEPHEVDLRGIQMQMSMFEVTSINARERGLRQLNTDIKQWQLSARRQDLESDLVHVVYTTEAKRRPLELPAQVWQLGFENIDTALASPVPDGVAQASIAVAGGFHLWRKGGWRFEPSQRTVGA